MKAAQKDMQDNAIDIRKNYDSSKKKNKYPRGTIDAPSFDMDSL